MKPTVAHYFDTHKDSNECFETSNGFLFHKKADATAHASSLTDKSVIPYTRSAADVAKASTTAKTTTPVNPNEEAANAAAVKANAAADAGAEKIATANDATAKGADTTTGAGTTDTATNETTPLVTGGIKPIKNVKADGKAKAKAK